MKTKTSQPLPPDEKWVLRAIKHVRYQIYYSSRINETILSDYLLENNGWIIDTEIEKFVHYISLVRF